MERNAYKELLAKKMSRKQFLQLNGGFLLVLFGLGGILPLLGRGSKRPPAPMLGMEARDNRFGTRKFGV